MTPADEPSDAPAAAVVHRPGQDRFEVVVDGTAATLTYELGPGRVAFTHTVVPAAIGGRGIAGRLTATAVAWARAEKLVIDPQCSYVREWLRRNG